MEKFLNFIRWFLIAIKVVKSEGKDSRGMYITNGIIKWNPLTYVVLFVACVVLGFIAFIEAPVRLWHETMKE